MTISTEDRVAERTVFTKHTSQTKRLVSARLYWTAEEYDLMEDLADLGMTTNVMALFFNPRPSPSALGAAMQRAGIPGRWERLKLKKPTNAELNHWAKVYGKWCEENGETPVRAAASTRRREYVRERARFRLM